MKYSLIISDLDGTVMGSDHKISKNVITAVNKWTSIGGLFTLATGRQYLMVKADCTNLSFDTPLITRGGAEIVDPKDGHVIYSNCIDQETVVRLINDLVSQNFKVAVEKDDTLYTTFPFAGAYDEILHKTLKDFVPSPVPKLVARSGNNNREEFNRKMEIIIKDFPNLHIVKSYTPLGLGWDITALSATKHLAVLELIKMSKHKPSEVVGIGNSYNDFPLLEACGLKVAMEDSPEELLSLADFVVPSVKEDGVVVLIDRLLKGI